jgi:hypothetical protein
MGVEMPEQLSITYAINEKPVATEILEKYLNSENIPGKFFLSYPVITASNRKYSIDATLVSPSKGIVLVD